MFHRVRKTLETESRWATFANTEYYSPIATRYRTNDLPVTIRALCKTVQDISVDEGNLNRVYRNMIEFSARNCM